MQLQIKFSQSSKGTIYNNIIFNIKFKKRLLNRSVWGRHSGSTGMITSPTKKSYSAPARTLSHFLSTWHTALFGHVAQLGESTLAHMALWCHIWRITQLTSWSFMSPPPRSSLYQVVGSVTGHPSTIHSEICGGVLLAVVIVVEWRDGPCQLCNSDDDDDDLIVLTNKRTDRHIENDNFSTPANSPA